MCSSAVAAFQIALAIPAGLGVGAVVLALLLVVARGIVS